MKKTPLYEAHLRLGARMVDFAGYLLPLQYTSIVEEHLAVRRAVGVFDVSHMGEFLVRGEEALAFLQWATANDAGKLKVGRAQYSMLPNERGGVVDDIYLYRLGEEEYLMVVNAANIAKDLAHLQALAKGFRVELEDASERTALLALQGPKAQALLQGLVDVDLSTKRKNDVFPARVAGRPARLARTGYTGEDGFELFLAPEDPGLLEARGGLPPLRPRAHRGDQPPLHPLGLGGEEGKGVFGQGGHAGPGLPGAPRGPRSGRGHPPGGLPGALWGLPRGPGDERRVFAPAAEGHRPRLRGGRGGGAFPGGGPGPGGPRRP